jgi:tRNA (guanosine-2'-O-)-methyltransferase
VHIIENRNTYTVNPDVALGSSKWLSLFKYNRMDYNTDECISELQHKGYRIVATTPHKEDTDINNLQLDTGKIALIFGTEKEGLTEKALASAEEYVRIPMFGFTESFNISVTAAICLFNLTNRLRESDIAWHLTEEEQMGVMLDWARSVVKKSALVEKAFLRSLNKGIHK